MKKLLSALYAMPGPVWLFGAYGVSRMWSWLLAWAASGSLPTTWTAAVTLLASLLPLTLLWLLLRRSPYAVQQVSLYAGLKSAAHFAALFLYRPVFGDLPGAFSVPASALLTNAVMCALWFGVLRYFERSEDIARLFPAEERRRTWWPAVPMAALILTCMSAACIKRTPECELRGFCVARPAGMRAKCAIIATFRNKFLEL